MSAYGTRRAVIIGCGIAGPALGVFLRRIGFDVVICERRSSEALDEGLFLGVAPNGMNVLAELGVDQALGAVGVPCRRFEFRNARDRVIGVIDREDDAARFGARLQMVRRSDLHRVLADAARAAGVRVEFGRTLTAIDRSTDASVTAHFADGSREQGDILIGADGIRSDTRRLVLPDAPEPEWSGLFDCGGITNTATVGFPAGVNVMVFGRRAFFGAFRTPSGQVWWFQNCSQKPADHALRNPLALRAHAASLHCGDPSWIRHVIESTGRIVGPFPLHDILFMPRWHDGRVCLAGDAAHATTPSSGQGASLALEDAMVLAQCLRDARSPELAFEAFERARRQRVQTIVRQSRRAGNTKAVPNRALEWVRDRLLPIFLRLGAAAQERQYAYRIDWTHRFA